MGCLDGLKTPSVAKRARAGSHPRGTLKRQLLHHHNPKRTHHGCCLPSLLARGVEPPAFLPLNLLRLKYHQCFVMRALPLDPHSSYYVCAALGVNAVPAPAPFGKGRKRGVLRLHDTPVAKSLKHCGTPASIAARPGPLTSYHNTRLPQPLRLSLFTLLLFTAPGVWLGCTSNIVRAVRVATRSTSSRLCLCSVAEMQTC